MATLTGDGAYVDVYSNETAHPNNIAAGWVGGRNLMLEKWDQTFGLITQLKGDILDALDALEALSDSDLPDNWQDILRDVVIDDVTPVVDTEGRPTQPTLNLPDNWPDEDAIPILGALKPVPTQDLTYTTPTLPDDVDPTFVYTQDTYISEILDPLYNKIYDVLVNGTSGLDEDAEQAIYDRAIARQRLTHGREYQRQVDAVGSDGWNFAAGAQASILRTSSENLAQEETNLNNDIIVQQAKLAYDAMVAFTGSGLDLEKIFREFFNATENRTLEARKSIAQFVLQKYSEQMKGYIAQWEGVKVELQAKAQVVDNILKENQVTLEVFKGEMSAYTAVVELIGKKTDAVVKGFQGEVDLFTAVSSERAAWWRALTEEQRTRIEHNRLELDKAIAEVRATVDSVVALDSLREKLAEGRVNATAQVLASALTAVSTSIGHDTRASESVSEQWSHQSGISENHNYDETET